MAAAELLLTGRNIPAQEALQLGLVNAVVADDQVEAKALEFAKAISANSPDSIIVLMHGGFPLYAGSEAPERLRYSVAGIRLTHEMGSVQRAFALNEASTEFRQLWEGENLQIG